MSKKIGLALSGGGARGFAHVGVLKVFAEHDIKFDIVAGTSAGSIIGGALAAGMTVDEIVDMSGKVGWLNMIRPSVSFGGVLSNVPMGKFLSGHLPVSLIEDMPTPFAAVAFDLATSKQVVIDRGDLVTAIRASCAVPGVFAPVRDAAGRMLVDGGVISPMPVETVRLMGADVVIAVDLLSCGATFRANSRTGVGIMIQSALSLLRTVAGNENSTADICIEPQIAHLRPDQLNKRKEFISLGELAARQKIEAILELIQ
ncbi:patatin-like phospholipase family protein [soil metagenome]